MDGDGSAAPGRSAPGGASSRSASTARRVGAVIGAAAVFAFGVVIGRTSAGTAASERPTPSPSTATSPTGYSTTSLPSPSPAGLSPSVPQSGGIAASTPPVGVLNDAFAAAITLPAADVQSAVAVDDQLVVLSPALFTRLSTTSGLRLDGTAAVGLPIGDPTYARWELVTDGSALWALTVDTAKRLYRVNPPSLGLGALIPPPAEVVDAAAVDGHLYLNTDVGVFDVTPSTAPGDQLQVVARGGPAMAADPSRHRLLVLNHDDGWMITAYDLSDRGHVVGASLPFEARTVAVADGTIWMAGVTNAADQRPVLARLDPATLRVGGHSVLESSLASPPTVVAGGTDLWIRGSDSGAGLWRLDAHSGDVVQHWAELPGTIVTHADQAFVIDGGVLGQLRLDAHP